MADVRLNHVSKRFGSIQALDDVSVHVEHQEFFCVLGPPGAGKTTLLRSIVGLERPEGGTVEIGGRDVTDTDPGKRSVGIVFQNLALYPDKTVAKNLGFPLRQQSPRPSLGEIDVRVREVAELLHIEPLLKRRPAHLSGGERQRVAIGRALVRAHDVYLFDEPLSSLDALLRVEMRAELKHLQRDLEKTLIYVTHDHLEAMSLADRICVLAEGRVQQVASPQEIYRRPANKLVAWTIGSPPINLIEMDVVETAGQVTLTSADVRIGGLQNGTLEALRALMGAAVTLGVRPEAVMLGRDAGESPLSCRVIAVEPLGAETIVDLELHGQIIKAMTPPGVAYRPDERLPIAFDLSAVHLFGGDGVTVYSADRDQSPALPASS